MAECISATNAEKRYKKDNAHQSRREEAAQEHDLHGCCSRSLEGRFCRTALIVITTGRQAQAQATSSNLQS
jgi:hypothetical protein